jgi:hypothetical protein
MGGGALFAVDGGRVSVETHLHRGSIIGVVLAPG